MNAARAALILATLVIATPPLMAVQWLLVRTSAPLARALPRSYHRFVTRLLGLRIKVVGTRVDKGPCLVAANHSSWLDIVVLSAIAPLSFVSKREVGSWPIFGSFARLQRTVFIDRDRRHATSAFKTEMQARLASGDTLVLFPEGTSTDGNRVLPFKSALMSAAEMTVDGRSVPVQPVTVAYTGLYGVPMGRETRPHFTWYGDMELAPHLWRALKLGPVDVTVVLHDPVTVDVLGGRKDLARHCETRVRQGLIAALTGRLDETHVPGELDVMGPEVGRRARLSGQPG